MSLPTLWTPQRLWALAGLAALGVLQAAAALGMAIAGSRLLTDPSASLVISLSVGGGAVGLVLLRVLQRRFAEAFALGYVAELRAAFISHVIRQPVDSTGVRFGLIMTRVVNDLTAIKLWLASGLVAGLVAAAVLLTIAVYFWVNDPALAFALLPALAFWLACVGACFKPLNGRIRESRRQRGRIAAFAGGLLSARLTLLIHGRHGASMRALSRRVARMNAALIGRATYSGVLRASGDLIFPAVALCLGLGLLGFERGTINAERLGVLVIATAVIATHANAMALAVEYRLAHTIAMARLTTVMRRPALTLDGGQQARLKRKAGGRRLAVNDARVNKESEAISFVAEPGDQTLLVSASAQDLTELMRAIARLTGLHDGRLAIDGIASADVSRRDWWRAVTLVSPDMRPPPATLGDNVGLGAPSHLAANERCRVAARFNLPPNLLLDRIREDAPPRGKRAIAIRAARAVLRQASIVLIDDPELVEARDLFTVLRDEIQRSGATLLVTQPAGQTPLEDFRIIDIDAMPDRSKAA